MQNKRSSEIGGETGEQSALGRHIESLDDIPREIASRRLHAEFGDLTDPAKAEIVRGNPGRIETSKEFEEAAKEAGIRNVEGVVGFAQGLETPPHVLKGDVGREIATLIHEDLHRLTHPLTRAEMTASESGRCLYEGMTERLTEKATEGLYGNRPGECYPDEVRHAKALEAAIGEAELKSYFLKHELPETIQAAIDRIERQNTRT